MSEQGFKGIPGVPEGWELMAVGLVTMGEWFVNRNGEPEQWNQDFPTTCMYAIIRKIEQPAKYRPFANAEEFERNRHRWWAWKDDRDNTFPPAAYGVAGHSREGWLESFERKVFDDGSPFGVEVTE